MYSKISTSEIKVIDQSLNVSEKLKEGEKIQNIEVLDKNRLLIVIENDKNIKGAIYDIKNNKFILRIE